MAITAGKSLIDAAVATDSMAAIHTATRRELINQGIAVNYTGSDATLSVQVVPSGGSVANSQLRIQSATVPANGRIYLNELIGQGLPAGAAVYAQASAVDSIAISLTGTEFVE